MTPDFPRPGGAPKTPQDPVPAADETPHRGASEPAEEAPRTERAVTGDPTERELAAEMSKEHAVAEPAGDANAPVPARSARSAKQDQPDQPEQADAQEELLPTEFHAPRRAPRYGRFALAGGLLGVLVAIALYLLSPGDSTYAGSTIGIVLFMYCVPTGAALGVLLALFVDRKSLKKRSESSSLEQ
ncbi:MAG: hypothetical protein Q4P33_07795 [Flaviflexus sp.]|nr:hypothetical protein [Flaviflexus sp.]